MSFDPRDTPVNDRIVARWLANEYPDRTPVDPERCYVRVPVLDLSTTLGGRRDRQLRYGESFEMLERRGDMAFGIARGEQVGYVGWVASDALARAADEPPGWDVKWVGARQTHAYSEPDFKAPERITLSHLSIVEVGPQSGRFTQTKLGWIPTVHLTGKDLTDPVEAASIYLGTPYLWGGNSCFGIDCSGLVQAACFACGIPSPGDSDQQARQLGEELPEGEPVKRGDLLCWKGHVAWVADEATILHANAHHMAVALEGMNEAIARIEAQGDGSVTTRKRLRELT